MFEVNKYRSDFAVLNKPNKKLVYFDNTCMSLKSKQVVEAMELYYSDFPACAGRSAHRLSQEATHAYQQARQSIARFIKSPSAEQIIVTRNTTEAINLVARSFKWQQGDIILTTDKEHNSNLVPWLLASQRFGLTHRILPSLPDNTFDLEAFSESVKGARLVAVSMTSNLDGVNHPIAEIVKLVHQNGALVLVDAAQATLHQKIDVQVLGVDFLALSGHKMIGPTGTGVLYGTKNQLEALDPFLVGGDTVSRTTYDSFELLPVPERFEAGLQDYAGIIGLGAAAEYLQQSDFDAIQRHEARLNEHLTEIILSHPKIKLIGPRDANLRSGIISFYCDGFDAHQFALMLDEMAGIAIRSGQHCVHSWFNARGIEKSARVSLAFYNNDEDVAVFEQAFKKISLLI